MKVALGTDEEGDYYLRAFRPGTGIEQYEPDESWPADAIIDIPDHVVALYAAMCVQFRTLQSLFGFYDMEMIGENGADEHQSGGQGPGAGLP